MADIIDAGISDGEILENSPEIESAEARAEAKEKQEFKELQSLAKSSAWKRLRKEFQDKIDKTNKFDYIDYSADFESVGQQVAAHKLLANELNEFMSRIDNSIEKGITDDE